MHSYKHKGLNPVCTRFTISKTSTSEQNFWYLASAAASSTFTSGKQGTCAKSIQIHPSPSKSIQMSCLHHRGFCVGVFVEDGQGRENATAIHSKQQVRVSCRLIALLTFSTLSCSFRMPGSLCAGNRTQSKLASIPEARDILRSEMLMMCRVCMAKTGNPIQYMPIII